MIKRLFDDKDIYTDEVCREFIESSPLKYRYNLEKENLIFRKISMIVIVIFIMNIEFLVVLDYVFDKYNFISILLVISFFLLLYPMNLLHEYIHLWTIQRKELLSVDANYKCGKIIYKEWFEIKRSKMIIHLLAPWIIGNICIIMGIVINNYLISTLLLSFGIHSGIIMSMVDIWGAITILSNTNMKDIILVPPSNNGKITIIAKL